MVEFSDELGAYVLEIQGIVFCWDEEPKEDGEREAERIAASYHVNQRKIADSMRAEIQKMYGSMEQEEIIEKLGKPMIDMENGQVSYVEQSFDDVHIFHFEFSDRDFTEIQYFSIDG